MTYGTLAGVDSRDRPVSRTGMDDRGRVILVGYGRGASGLAEALSSHGHRVTSFTRFSSCLREATKLEPDSVLVGADPAAGDPFPFLGELVEAAPRTVTIALAPSRDPRWIDRALSAGAHDILPPPHSVAAILLRRRVLLRTRRGEPLGESPLSRRVPLGPLTVDLNRRQVLDGSDPLTLSGREFELLVRLMKAAGEVVERAELIRDIWGADQGSEAVLDATVHRLRRKLDEKLPDRDLVATVRGVGYRLEPSPAG